MGGLPSLTDASLKGARNFDAMMEIIQQAAPASVLFQFATHDSWISRAAAQAHYEAASEPKAIRWYPTSHEFTDVASLLDRAAWLRREVGVGSVVPLLEQAMKAQRP